MPLSRVFCIAGLLTASISPAFAASYGPELQGFQYPYPLEHFHFQSQGKALQMGYMDVPAKGQPNGRSVVLMHGKNFCGATWEGTIKALSDAGYRVVAPDQIGFCSSSKPDHYQYSFQQLALNTHQLLENNQLHCRSRNPNPASQNYLPETREKSPDTTTAHRQAPRKDR